MPTTKRTPASARTSTIASMTGRSSARCDVVMILLELPPRGHDGLAHEGDVQLHLSSRWARLRPSCGAPQARRRIVEFSWTEEEAAYRRRVAELVDDWLPGARERPLGLN